MKQMVRVTAIRPDGTAVVFLQRQSACSGDCHQCSGCGAVRETLFVTAENPIGAAVGDTVMVETSTATVMKAAVLVYLVPVILFFVGYFAGQMISFLPGILGAVGFVLGILPAILLNHKMTRSHEQTFRIVSFAQEN